MTISQRIVRVRRQYNRWVADQTLEDYALRFTATRARRWSIWAVCNTALGSSSFLALEAIGAAITFAYGFQNAIAAIAVVSAIIFIIGLPVAYYAARYGVDIDLLTRGAGFGYIGSTITSLIYATFTFIFFALEAVILAAALNLLFGLPLWIGYLIGSLGIIPLVTHGITFISRLQRLTQLPWLVLQFLPFLYFAFVWPESFSIWAHHVGIETHTSGMTAIGFGMAASVVFSLITQIGEQVDFLRFMPRQTPKNRKRWFVAMGMAGPGWIIIGGFKLIAGSYFFALALHCGINILTASDPAHMYLTAFRWIFPAPMVGLLATGAFILLAQIKINVTNAYAGSIAWSNFFSRLTHSHPGRVVWLVFNVAIAILLMGFGVYAGLVQILALYSILAASWLGSIFADLIINKPLGLSPPGIEFRRAHLYDINPVGLGSMCISTFVAGLACAGVFGKAASAYAVFLALGTALLATPAIAAVTKGRFYLARKPTPPEEEVVNGVRCCICGYEFEPEDMTYCPAYGGQICSLCCSLDARCHDGCKENARFSDQIRLLLEKCGITIGNNKTFLPVVEFFATTLALGLAITLILYMIYSQTVHQNFIPHHVLLLIMAKVLAAEIGLSGVVAWLLVLARDSHRVADEETKRQTALLTEEIEAHKQTDAKLQKAKDVAEAANLAKTRFVRGINHELRAPLNAIFGYAQLLEGDPTLHPAHHKAVQVIRRSSEHLSGLIDGLVDISRIESGHMRLNIENIRLPDFLDQIAGMFRIQAREKGIHFDYVAPKNLPPIVRADASRLRQILINLLSNAVKFTEQGTVRLVVRYHSSQLVEFEISDTGFGIPPHDLERIFEPFERGQQSHTRTIQGMGLGLTITRMLTEMLGGRISVTSEVGKGSIFLLCLMLAESKDNEGQHIPTQHITGYRGRRRTLLVVDDDTSHLSLMREVLVPLNFRVICASDGDTCMALAEQFHPDMFLLDILMPGENGLTIAKQLRSRGFPYQPIMIISGNATDNLPLLQRDGTFSDYLVKPFQIPVLLEKIARLLKLEWSSEKIIPPVVEIQTVPLPHKDLTDLKELADIGYIAGIRAKLDTIEKTLPNSTATLAPLRADIAAYDLTALNAQIEKLLERNIQ